MRGVQNAAVGDLGVVASKQAYFYHQEHFRGLAITQASNTDVYLAEGGLHASRDSEAAPTPRFVGYFVENKASVRARPLRATSAPPGS